MADGALGEVMGEAFGKAAVRLAEAGADIIGANCGCGIEAYVGIAARLRGSMPCTASSTRWRRCFSQASG